jgi:pimeloyl-ACP methyl ester carboxylesterase
MIILTVSLVCIAIVLLLLKAFSYTSRIKNGISKIRKIRIGGINQFFLIRGENVENPILLYLHGGPGTTELIPFTLFHKNLEKHFTIVIWEQRGTGKSFSKKIPESTMTISQFISDAHELIEYLRTQYNKDKIVLAGHSWGTALGLLLVQKYPDLFFAYIGSGQKVNPKEGEALGYHYILSKSKNNVRVMNELKKINTPEPYLTIDNDGGWYHNIKVQRKWLVATGGEMYKKSDYSLLFNVKTMFAPEYSWSDFINFGRGSIFSLKTMWPEIMKLNFMQEIPEVTVPVYFLQGRNDYNTPAVLVEKFYTTLKAPSKELVWFEKSGHHPMYEEPEKYDTFLVENVLPLCK